MIPRDCDNLDAYLAGELVADEAACFEAHLAACHDCRTTLDQQRWIGELLHSPLAAELEAPPTAVLPSFRMVTKRHRRRQFFVGGLAAAAVVVVAVGWTSMLLNRSMHGAVGPVVTAVAADHVSPPQLAPAASPSDAIEADETHAEPPRATFVGGPDVLVVPVASRHPNVTIVQVYPVYQPEYAVQASAALPGVTDDFLWTDELNDLNDLNGGSL